MTVTNPFSNTNTTQEAAAREAIHATSKMGSGAEQDRYAAYFSHPDDGLKSLKKAAIDFKGIGAEQDRYQSHFHLDAAKVKAAAESLLNVKGEGAEQDRHASHFGLGADGWARAKAMANAKGIGAEQVCAPVDMV
jgi:hypothetical protein